jgi:hypothetical protein
MPLASDVFPPGSTPVLTYVQRKFQNRHTGSPRDPEQEIRLATAKKGVLVQLIGPSKSGKTVAIERTLGASNLVKVSGAEVTDANALWRTVLSYLSVPVSQKTQRTSVSGTVHGTDMGATISAPIVGGTLKHSQGSSRSQTHSTTHEHLDDFFLTARTELLAKAKTLFLDDFHAIPAEHKPAVASQLKRAAEDGVRVCLAEVPHRSDEPVRGMPDLTGRLQRVEFEYWRTEDLMEIASKGFSALGVKIGPSIISALATEACGSPQLMQMLCSSVCDYFSISETVDPPVSLAITYQILTHICSACLSGIYLDGLFHDIENALSTDENAGRYAIHGMGSCSISSLLMAALAIDPPIANISLFGAESSLFSRATSVVAHGWSPPSRSVVTSAMRELRVANATLSSALPPIDMDELGRITIVDPYFYFYLRWQAFYKVRVAVLRQAEA